MPFSETAVDPSAIAAGLAAVVKKYGIDRLELEFRLGFKVAGKFVPGVSREGWTKLKERLDASAVMSSDVRVTKTRELITGDGSGGKYVIDATGREPPHWMHKKRLKDFDVDLGAYSCRASMSLEVVDPPDKQQPPPAAHKFERVKERWSYRHRCWSVDITRVESNLPHQLDNDAMSYEVEIELRHPKELFTRPMPVVVDWGLTLAKDMCDMLK